MTQKKTHGQFFTVNNPFNNELFKQWLSKIPNLESQCFVEPFAGANNIVKMMQGLGYSNYWKCFDILPPKENSTPEFQVVQHDVLKSFPKDVSVVITNPPYLAKNSATRDGLPFPETKHDDLYKLCLDVMLENVDYVAAIIPESFITQKIFQERLYGVISLTHKMFNDTDCPVCLALFVPENNKEEFGDKKDFIIYQGTKKWGLFSEALKNKLIPSTRKDIVFNAKDGELGLYAIDGTRGLLIRFVRGETIDGSKIKVSSRGVTRIKLNADVDIDECISKLNELLASYRKNTNDIFLTAFRGLRLDDKYRRRLDFSQAKSLITEVLTTKGK